MNYSRILTIQDISCVGQCSLTVALPILSACGHETAILPSAVLSTHTAGFQGFTVRDLSQDIPAIGRHWVKEGISFDAIYTGYLGTEQQIDDVATLFRTVKRPQGRVFVDPAMGDHGKLYPAFDLSYAKAMARLCADADVILPNVTEACFMTGVAYEEVYTPQYIEHLLTELHKLGPFSHVVLTGIGYEDNQTGVLISGKDGTLYHYVHEKLSRSYHGTGDIFSSAFVGSFLQTGSMERAAQIAADFTVCSISTTLDDENHWYGVKFESVLGSLIQDIQK